MSVAYWSIYRLTVAQQLSVDVSIEISANISVDMSVNMSTDTSAECQPTWRRHIGWTSVDMSTDTRPICRSRGAQNTHVPSLRASSPLRYRMRFLGASHGARADRGEIRRACNDQWRNFISIPKTPGRQRLDWISPEVETLFNQNAQSARAIRSQHDGQAVGCLYFGRFKKASVRIRRSLPTERIAGYCGEKSSFKSWRSCRATYGIQREFNLPVVYGGERSAGECESLWGGDLPGRT